MDNNYALVIIVLLCLLYYGSRPLIDAIEKHKALKEKNRHREKLAELRNEFMQCATVDSELARDILKLESPEELEEMRSLLPKPKKKKRKEPVDT